MTEVDVVSVSDDVLACISIEGVACSSLKELVMHLDERKVETGMEKEGRENGDEDEGESENTVVVKTLGRPRLLTRINIIKMSIPLINRTPHLLS